jgi:hypothetical protein
VDLKRIHDEVVFHYKELMETIDQRDRWSYASKWTKVCGTNVGHLWMMSLFLRFLFSPWNEESREWTQEVVSRLSIVCSPTFVSRKEWGPLRFENSTKESDEEVSWWKINSLQHQQHLKEKRYFVKAQTRLQKKKSIWNSICFWNKDSYLWQQQNNCKDHTLIRVGRVHLNTNASIHIQLEHFLHSNY